MKIAKLINPHNNKIREDGSGIGEVVSAFIFQPEPVPNPCALASQARLYVLVAILYFMIL